MALSGTSWGTSVAGLGLGPAYSQAVLKAALEEGSWVRWPMTAIAVQSASHRVVFAAADDYFAIGDGADFVRAPMDPLVAQTLADALGFELPTPRMVDRIWEAAPTKLKPVTGGQIGIAIGRAPGPSEVAQTSAAGAILHHGAVETQRALLGFPAGLTGGHKKDVVRSNLLEGHADRVCIYGWHPWGPEYGPKPGNVATPGVAPPIQGNSTFHEVTYWDYSHGIRMVSPVCEVDGQESSLAAVLASPELAPLLSHEGVLRVLRQPDPPKGTKGLPTCMGFGGSCAAPGEGQGSSSWAWIAGLAAIAAGGAVYKYRRRLFR